MQAATNNKKVNTYFSWSTTKVEGGFRFKVFMCTSLSEIHEISGNYNADELIQTGVLPTRARAKTKAAKWIKWFKQEYKRANA